VDYALQQTDLINSRQEGTGEWLLKSDEFQRWLKQDRQTLFCPGIPGAGKTVMTSVVVHHLHNKFEKEPSIGTAYIYCNFRRQHEQKPSDLLLSLIKQLVQEKTAIPNIVRDIYSRHSPKRTRPSYDEILDALHRVTAPYSRTFVLVDALDECQISHRSYDMFLQAIFNLQAKAGVNIFATSRFIKDIEKKFDKSIRLEICASDIDVQNYLDGKLQNFQSSVLKDHSLKEEIKSRIAKAADGMHVFFSDNDYIS
jgi:Cdc6-like AAA superfamily ATPase